MLARLHALAAVVGLAAAFAVGGSARAQSLENPLRGGRPAMAAPRDTLSLPAGAGLASDDEAPVFRAAQNMEELPPARPMPTPDFVQPDEPMHYGWPGEGGLGGSPPLGAKWLADDCEPWLWRVLHGHSDPNDPQRYRGSGHPLQGTSWRNRPWYWGAFLGTTLMDDLLDGAAEQSNTAIAGLRLGWDFDHYWGLEGRFAFANPHLFYPADPTLVGDNHLYLADLSLLHYPWGDSQWRPFLQVGLGAATARFEDAAGLEIHDSAFAVPFGGGLKYFYAPWFTLRVDVLDNLCFGSQRFDTMHNVSFNIGAEFRFGGRRTNYFPWTGAMTYW